MVSGVSNILTWYESHSSSPYWSLYQAKNSDRISESSQDESFTLTDGKEELEKTLSLLGSGTYYLVQKQSLQTSKTGLYNTRIEIVKADKEKPVTTSPGVNISTQNIEEIASKKFAEYQEKFLLQQRIQQMEIELKELRANKENGLEKTTKTFLDTMMPYVPNIMDKFGVKPAVSGTNRKINNSPAVNSTASPKQTNMTDQEKLEKAMEIMMQHAKPDFLLALAEEVDKDPSLIDKVSVILGI